MLAVRHPADAVRDRVAKRVVAFLQLPEPVSRGEPLCLDDDGGHQMVSAKRGSARRKTVRPKRKMSPAIATLTANGPACGGGVPTSAQRKPVITPVTGLSERIHCHFGLSAA